MGPHNYPIAWKQKQPCKMDTSRFHGSRQTSSCFQMVNESFQWLSASRTSSATVGSSFGIQLYSNFTALRHGGTFNSERQPDESSVASNR